MKRFWVAMVLALGFHGVVLNMDPFRSLPKRQAVTFLKPVELTLSNETPKTLKKTHPAQPPDPQPENREPEWASQIAQHPKPRFKAEPKVRPHYDPRLVKMHVPKTAPQKSEEQALPGEIGLKTEEIPALVPSIGGDPKQATLGSYAPVADDEGQPGEQSPNREAVPIYDRNPPPRYPQQARKRGFQGTVILKVLVGKDGRVADIRLQESCGHSILDQVALETVRDWAFTPGRRGENPVEMWIRVPMLFELK